MTAKKATGGYSRSRADKPMYVTYSSPKPVKPDCDNCGSKQVIRCKQTYMLKCAHCQSVWE